MRTLDTSAVTARIFDRLKTYPEGSISKREVVANVPCNGDIEKLGWELNGKLTKAIYSYWQQAALDKPQHHAKSRDELTKLAQDTALKLADA